MIVSTTIVVSGVGSVGQGGVVLDVGGSGIGCGTKAIKWFFIQGLCDEGG